MFVSEENSSVGLQNMLLVDRRKYGGVLGQLFPHLSHVCHVDLSYTMPDLRRDTLQAKRVRDAVEFCARAAVENSRDSPEPVQYQHAVAQQEKRASTIINGMSAGLFKTLLRITGLWGTTGVPPQPLQPHGLHHHVLRALQCWSACATHCSWRQP